jgi:hypothetical protein
MSNAAASGTVVSLDEYRRTRGDRRAPHEPMRSSTPAPMNVAPVWVYWVPVWVW